MYMRLFTWSNDSYPTIEDAIESGALYRTNTLTTLEKDVQLIDLSNNTELLNAIETGLGVAKMLGYIDSIQFALGTIDHVLFQYNTHGEWVAVEPIPTRKVHTPSNLRKGDLVWSQYYSRLGVITQIVTTGYYSPEKPCYVLGDVSDPSKTILSGDREESRSTNHPNVVFRLIKIADGFGSKVVNK